MMFILIDNYDSFVYNLYHYMGELGAEVTVFRNDAVSVADVMARKPEGIVLSPGPCTPDDAGICVDLVTAAAGKVPLLGVCLGHQAIGQAFGGRVIRAPYMMHGKVSVIHHNGAGVLAGLPDPFRATRYHSLIVDRDGLPAALEVTAWTDDGIIMGLMHRDPAMMLWGVQFHPESIESENGHDILRNFIAATRRPAAA